MDQYEAAREIKELGRCGPEVVGMCKGQGTTDLWIPGNLKAAFSAIVRESRGISPENRPSGQNSSLLSRILSLRRQA